MGNVLESQEQQYITIALTIEYFYVSVLKDFKKNGLALDVIHKGKLDEKRMNDLVNQFIIDYLPPNGSNMTLEHKTIADMIVKAYNTKDYMELLTYFYTHNPLGLQAMQIVNENL